MQKGVIEDIVAVLNTNVIGTMGMCTAFFPGMVERQRGHVINIGSVSGYVPLPSLCLPSAFLRPFLIYLMLCNIVMSL